jgi:hypothetical protein
MLLRIVNGPFSGGAEKEGMILRWNFFRGMKMGIFMPRA